MDVLHLQTLAKSWQITDFQKQRSWILKAGTLSASKDLAVLMIYAIFKKKKSWYDGQIRGQQQLLISTL